MREPDHHVHRVVRVDLEEVAVVDDHADHVLDVVRLFRVVRDDGRQSGGGALRVVGRLDPQGLLVAALGNVFEELAHLREALLFTFGQEMRDARLDVVDLGSTQRVEGHILAGGDANHLGPCDEHVADAVDHEGEVRDRG